MKNQEEQKNALGFYSELTRSLYKKKALVIDDDPVSWYLHRHYLQKLDFLVDVVSTRQNALKHVYRKQYGLMITNLRLGPNIDEFIITQLRQLPSLNSNTPLIVVTAAESSLKPRCIKAGAKEFVVKPLTIEILESILNEIFYLPKTQSF
ncbi:response regulator [Rickettsiella endosymbiont of Dermanyssus gallinae]|uniref:response regulator n=1 Tax=Rickettsiella endosymbiont of Dermanyssus gallinae TaxID=2856608 RepID=UPI001C52B22F|nr:response regulator [Rickettsiella endosymbiont of Dermanyssus gallinae]